MAAECDEAIEVSEGGAPAVTTDEGEVEMTIMGSNPASEKGEEMNSAGSNIVDNNSSLEVVVHSASLQEPSVLFVVKDVTDTDWQKSRFNYSLPYSSAVTDLYAAIAKEAGYEEDSFLLSWYDKELDNPDDATPLSPKSTQTLYELGMSSEPDRVYLFLLNSPDSPPVKSPSNNKGTGQSVTLASSITTTTSTHTFSNSSNSSWSSYHYSNKSDTGFVGLVNQAMTCYLNSLLQTLYMTPEFRSALYSWKFRGDIGEGIKNIPYQLQRLFIHLQTSSKRAVETTDVTKSFGWDSSEAWQQHDVQELCRVMFDALEKRFRKDGHEQPELINELYQGDMKDYVKCLECNNESAREDHFLDIPLVIKPFGASRAYTSVEEALDGFVDPETLIKDNQYHCDKCKKKCDAHKGLKFTRFPYLLTLQLKRFDFDYSTMHRIKLNDRMTFPKVLNLNKFVDSSDMPEADSTEDLDSLYRDFIVEKFENRSAYIMRSSDSASSMPSGGEESITGSKVAEMLKQGPYVYELFSIMIHSGSAIGGHYYAYIKSLSDKQWYSFNDQSVTRISRDDIEQTFGGSDRSRGYYTSMYASSANAYMLMYRKIDKKNNRLFPVREELPEHILELIKEEQRQEQYEKERQEWEKNLCKFRVFMRHPSNNELVERKIEVHKDQSLKEAIQEAHAVLGLSQLVPVERCRLVRYDEYTETLDQSFDDTKQEISFGSHVGGARSYYSFELFMEIRPEGSEFKVYNKGGLNLKTLVIDLPEETVRDPVQLRAEQGWRVTELKDAIAEYFSLDSSTMTLALETYQYEGKPLTNLTQTLKNEGFYRKHTVFVCCDPDDYAKEFKDSLMNKVIDKYANTISLFVTIPPPPSKPKIRADGSLIQNELTPQENCRQETFEDNFMDPTPSSRTLESESGSSVGCSNQTEQPTAWSNDVLANGDMEGNDPSQQAMDLVGAEGTATPNERCGDNTNEENYVTTVNDNNEELATEEVIGDMEDVNRPLQRTITVQIDRRKTLGDLKKMLEAKVLVPATDFKIYRVYSNNQEYEIFRLQDSLQSVPNETRMIVRLGRALLPGEFRIKLSLLRVNEVEYFKSLMDSIVAKGMTVRELKERLVKEAYEQGIEYPLKIDRMRLRKKTWRSPGTVYLDHQLFEKDIHVFANYEMFIEPLENEDKMKHATQMQVYVRHWKPSEFVVEDTSEIIIDENTPEHLREKLSEFSGIPANRIQFAKAYGSFPCEMSILDIENDLDWNPTVSTISSTPLAIYDDGAILYFKDCEESLAELTSEKKAEIQKRETARLSKCLSGTSHTRYTYRQEKAVKIWSEDDDTENSSQPASEG